MKSEEIILSNNIRLYHLYGSEYKMGYDYGYFNKNKIDFNNMYNEIILKLKNKFDNFEYQNIIFKINSWISTLKNNNHIDFYIGFCNATKLDIRKILFISIIFSVYGYFCTIISNKIDSEQFHFRICDSNNFSNEFQNKFNVPLDIINYNNKYYTINYFYSFSKHTIISNKKFGYSIKSSYKTDYKTNFNNKYPIIFYIFIIYQESNSLNEFRNKIKELKLDDSTFISSYNNNEFNLISLNKKIKDQIIHNNGFLEISDYSPIINKPVSINTILEKYNSIPDRNRMFTIIKSPNNKLLVNNYLDKDEFIEINLENKIKNEYNYNIIILIFFILTSYIVTNFTYQY